LLSLVFNAYLYGLFLTPRLHARYELRDGTVLRASAGRGQRTANIFIENMAVFASSRTIEVLEDSDKNPYGLNPEIAWNFGFHLTQEFTLDYREGTINLDFYRTDFQNQVVVDLDSNPQKISFYNLNGNSYSNSFQAEIQYELLRRFDIKMAYRWLDVRTTYKENLLRIRREIQANPEVFQAILNAPDFREVYGELRGNKNKILPKEFKADQEHIPTLFYKQFFVMAEYPSQEVLLRTDLLDFVMRHYQILKPLNDYLKEAILT